MRFIDPDGMQPIPNGHKLAQGLAATYKELPQGTQKAISGAVKMIGGGASVIAGAAGTIASGGIGGALGGVSIMVGGMSTFAIGLGQFVDGVNGNKSNEKKDQILGMNNIVGAVAAGLGSEHAEKFDVATSFALGVVGGGNMNAIGKVATSINEGAKTAKIAVDIINAANAALNISGVVNEFIVNPIEDSRRNKDKDEDKTQTH